MSDTTRLGSAQYYFSLIAFASYFVATLSYLKIYYFIVLFAAWISVLIALTALKDPAYLVRDSARIILIFFYLALTSVWADDPQRTLVWVAIDSIYIFVWLIAYVLARNNDERRVSGLFIVMPYVIGSVYAYLLVRHGTVRAYDAVTYRSIGSISNVASTTLAICVPFILWRAVNGERRRLFELTLAYLLIVVSQSRAGILLAFFCTCMFLAAGGFHGIRKAAAVASLALIASLLVVFVTPDFRRMAEGALHRFFDETAITSHESPATQLGNTFSERDAMLTVGWKTFIENPFFGIGYHNLGPRVKRQYSQEVVSHSLFLTFVVEAGWPALFLLWFVFLGALSRLIQNIRTQPPPARGYYQACLIALIAMLPMSMVHMIHQFQIFYIILAFAYASPIIRRPSTVIVKN